MVNDRKRKRKRKGKYDCKRSKSSKNGKTANSQSSLQHKASIIAKKDSLDVILDINTSVTTTTTTTNSVKIGSYEQSITVASVGTYTSASYSYSSRTISVWDKIKYDYRQSVSKFSGFSRNTNSIITNNTNHCSDSDNSDAQCKYTVKYDFKQEFQRLQNIKKMKL